MGALALMAMLAFTLDLSLFRGNAPSARNNPVMFKLAGHEVRAGDLEAMRRERLRANLFMQSIGGGPSFFGGTSDEEMRQAMVLEREADRLGIPGTGPLANTWLRELSPNLTPELFDQIYRAHFTDGPLSCTDSQLLHDIGRQFRLNSLTLLEMSQQRTTPLDLYLSHRDQSERVSALSVALPVERYLGEVAQPTDSEVEAFYDQYNDQLPDPNRDTPGFKLPRRVRVEYLQVDSAALQKEFRDALTDDDLRAYFKDHQKDLPPPPRELPQNLFAGDPEAKLTPRTTEPFFEMKETIRTAAAEARARDEIDRKFTTIRDDVMSPFLSQYDQVVADNADLAEQKSPASKSAGAPTPLPRPLDASGRSILLEAGEKLGLEYHETPLMSQSDAEKRVPISGASLGSRRFGGGRSFVDQLFNSRGGLYESLELSDARGLRFLAWKTEDLQPEVPPLANIREQVVRAWKERKARDLAEREAKALADKAREAHGDLRSVAGDLTVTPTSEVSKLARTIDPTSRSGLGAARVSEIPEIPNPSEALRDALFSLKPGDVVVEPNAPKTTYYVLAYYHRTPADLGMLFSPVGARNWIEREVDTTKARQSLSSWVKRLEAEVEAGPLLEARKTRSARVPEPIEPDHDMDEPIEE
jgi:peptidyl-prolyl cis-trans isomerase D